MSALGSGFGADFGVIGTGIRYIWKVVINFSRCDALTHLFTPFGVYMQKELFSFVKMVTNGDGECVGGLGPPWTRVDAHPFSGFCSC